jgi:hypothetical protein
MKMSKKGVGLKTKKEGKRKGAKSGVEVIL